MIFKRKCLLIGMTLMTLALLSLPPSVRAGELEDAHTVYQEKYVSIEEGVYADGDILFVVSEIPWGNGVTSTLQAKAMLRGKELLQSYVADHFLDATKKPPPSLLKKSFPQAVAFGRETVPGLGLPVFDMNMRIRVLEDKAIKEQGYRYGIAMLLDDVRRNIPVGLYGEPSQEEMIAAMKKTWAAREKRDELAELCRSFGLIEDLLLHDPASEESAPVHGFPKGVPSRPRKTVSPVAISWELSGHADFSVMNAVLPQEYRTAGQLYDQGIELPRILTLAARSAELAPANAAAWSLLGQALYADEQAAAAVPFLVQALRIDPKNADTRTFLAMAYLAGGQRDLAKGMAASVLFACTNESAWSITKASEILENIQE